MKLVLAALRRHWPLVIPVLFECILFQAWLHPGLVIGSDWVRRNHAELVSWFPWPHLWNAAQQIGENNEVFMSSFPIFALCGLLARFGLDWSVIERVCFLWPYLVLAPWGSYALGYRLTRMPFAAAIGSFVFIVSSWTIAMVERGGIPSIVAAAGLAFVAIAAINFIEHPTPRRALGLAGALMLIMVYDLRFVYIALVFCLILGIDAFVRDRSFTRLRAAAPGLATLVIALFIFNLYWIVPQIASPARTDVNYGTPYDYFATSSYMDAASSLALYNTYYHWVADLSPFLVYTIDPGFFALPVLALAGIALTWRRRFTRAIAVAAALAILLEAGPNPPLGALNLFIYEHVPGMTLFRDVTKWMSLHSLAYDVAIALGVSWLIARLRLRLGRVIARQAAVAALALFAIMYVVLLRDAFNPIRYRSFTVEPPAADEVALEQFLQGQSGFSRTLVFPRDVEPMRATDARPYIEAQQLANGDPYDGYRDYDPDWSEIFWFYSQPFVPDLLRELAVRYVVVPYDVDRIVFKPDISYTEFDEAVSFWRAQRWIRFDRWIGRNAVFELRDWRADRGFIAPYPVVLDGTGQTIPALVGSVFWSPQAAPLLAYQNWSPLELQRIPNVVVGPQVLNAAQYPPAKLRSLQASLGDLDLTLKTQPLAFRAYAATRFGMASNLKSWLDPQLFNATFESPASGTSHVSLSFSQPAAIPGEVARVTFATPARPPRVVADNAAAIIFDDTGAQSPFVQVDAATEGLVREHDLPQGEGDWYGFTGREGTIGIAMKAPVPMQGDLTLPAMVTPEGPSARAVLDLNGVEAAPIIPPRRLGWLLGGGVPVTFHNVVLYPGDNDLRVSIESVISPQPSNVNLWLRGDAKFTRRRVLTGRTVVTNLPLQLRPSSNGLTVFADATAPAMVEQRTTLNLIGGINLPLALRPFVDIDYTAPARPVLFQLEVELRRRRDGAPFRFVENLTPAYTHEFFDVRSAVESALDATFLRDLEFHAKDPNWLRLHRLTDEGDGAAAFDMIGLRLAVVKPLGAEAAGATGERYAGHLGLVRLALASPWLGPSFHERVASSARLDKPADLTVKGFALTQRSGTPGALRATLRFADSPRLVDPAAGLTGANVTLTLVDSSKVEGVVRRESAANLTVDLNSGGEIGITKSSIVRVLGERYVVQQADLTLPIAAPPDAHILQLYVARPRELELRILLGFAPRAGAPPLWWVFPGRERDYRVVEEQIPKDWESHVPSPFSAQPLPLGIPRDFIEAQQGADWFQYHIDLQQVKGYRLDGDQRAALAAVRLEFRPLSGLPTTHDQYARIAVADVATIDRDASGASSRRILGKPVLALDRRPLTVRRLQGSIGNGEYAASAGDVELSRGLHQIASVPAWPWRVDSVLISHGQPRKFSSSTLSAVRDLSSTQYEGQLSSRGGLLVLSEAYDPGWRAYLLAPGASGTGFTLFDILRFGGRGIAPHDHFIANDMLDAWWVPPGSYEVLVVFVPQAYAELGAILTLILGGALGFVTLRWFK